MKSEKFIDNISVNVIRNRIKLFYKYVICNIIIFWYKKIFKWNNKLEKTVSVIIPILNIFIFNWISDFIIIVVIDICLFVYLKKKSWAR
jgi:hypothetical protein